MREGNFQFNKGLPGGKTWHWPRRVPRMTWGTVGAYLTGCGTDLGTVTVKATVAYKNHHGSVRAIGMMIEAKMGSEECSSSHSKICSIPKIYTFHYKYMPIILNEFLCV